MEVALKLDNKVTAWTDDR